MCVGADNRARAWKKALDPLEVELQASVTWLLGTKFCSSGRAASTLNHRAFSPAHDGRLLAMSERVFSICFLKREPAHCGCHHSLGIDGAS